MNGRATTGAGGEPEPLLEVRDLSIVYDENVKAVDHVDLALGRGETVGLAGESGCGKSTLALGLCRLLRPPAVITSGSVIYRGSRLPAGGVDLMEQTSRELRKLRWREISVVFQSAMNALNPVLRVRDQLGDAIDAHLKLRRREKQDRLERAARPRRHPARAPAQLPPRALRRHAPAGHDRDGARSRARGRDHGRADDGARRRRAEGDPRSRSSSCRSRLHFAVLFITHDLSLLLEIADRIAVMYAGRIVEIGTAEKIHNEPSHPYTQGLLGSFPSVHGARRELAGIPGSPPDLRALPPGCPFVPRCAHAGEQCREIDMSLARVTDADASHLTACPFVRPAMAGDRALTARTASVEASARAGRAR